jgi:hypothetical protein
VNLTSFSACFETQPNKSGEGMNSFGEGIDIIGEGNDEIEVGEGSRC